jgi:acetolactate synthase regulatory subunit
MNYAHLTLSFSVSAEHAFNTLEAVLAIARRGGLAMGQLELGRVTQAGTHGVLLEVCADEPDRLDLFMLRLQGVFDITDLSALAPAEHLAA